MWVPCSHRTLPPVWKSPGSQWPHDLPRAGIFPRCMLNLFQTLFQPHSHLIHPKMYSFFTEHLGAVEPSPGAPFCLSRLFFLLWPPSTPLLFSFLFLEEFDLLPKINETLAPSSSQNLLADKLEMESGLGERRESVEREGGFHLGQVQTWTQKLLKWLLCAESHGGGGGGQGMRLAPCQPHALPRLMKSLQRNYGRVIISAF